MYLLGIDLGSSFVKASIIDSASGRCLGAASAPEKEMTIISRKPGWAEQEPAAWWQNVRAAVHAACRQAGGGAGEKIAAIGISYQMHGLVLTDRNNSPLRPAIIWCDSRAVEVGQKAFAKMSPANCLRRMLNSPGNFTASKLAWVKKNEPKIFAKAASLMLPGDYIALLLTGRRASTISGLSEGIMWDFAGNGIARQLLKHYHIPESFIPELVPTFGDQGIVTAAAAAELGIKAGVPVTYRAGDQPNNAFSLNVLEPGEVAATAGTSGVMYGVTDKVQVDRSCRVNTFAHVNHTLKKNRLGVLLCVNGTGIANAWTKRLLGETMDYETMDRLAATVPIGSDGLIALPFGNGAERVLGNRDPGAMLLGMQFNRHTKAHVCRAVQEGIAFALIYGLEVMRGIGVKGTSIRAGKANMFLSGIFRDTIAGTGKATIELYNTDGAQGAARGAGLGAGIYANAKQAFKGLTREQTVKPAAKNAPKYAAAYESWKDALRRQLGNR